MENINFSLIDDSVKIGENVVIKPFCIIKGDTIIESNTIIENFTYIENSHIGSNCKISNSHIENSFIENNVEIGPYTKIIKECIIKDNAIIGNFVEIKNSSIGSKTKIKHHTYVGDSIIGEECNIGCGVVFANYNGKTKNKIIIKDNVFVGSNSVLIAPLTIEDNCYICASTNLTKSLEEGSFVIGRSRETIKSGIARKYLKKYKEK